MLSVPTLSCLRVFQFNSALTSGQVYHIAFVLNRPGLHSSAGMFLKLYSLERKTRDYKKCWHHSHPKWIFLNYPITCPNSPWRFGKGGHSDGVALSRKTCPWPFCPKKGFLWWSPRKPPLKSSGTKRGVNTDTYEAWVGWVGHTPDWLMHPPPPKYSSVITLMVASSTFVVSQLFLPPNCRDAKEFTDCLGFLTNWGNSML